MKTLIILFLTLSCTRGFAQCHVPSHFAPGQHPVENYRIKGGSAINCVDLVVAPGSHVYAWNNTDNKVEFIYDSDMLHKGSIKIVAKPHTSVALSIDAKNITANSIGK